MKIYSVRGEERSGRGNIIITADKKKAKRLAKIFNGYIEEYEEEYVLNNEKEIVYAAYFRYPGIGKRLDLVIKDMVHATEIFRGFEGENK